MSGMHVAIIMDGNGRWARARGRPRIVGHHEGARAVRSVVEAAPKLGIGTLTLYAFSSDNWQRPASEVRALMGLFERHLESARGRLVEAGVRLEVIGRRDRLSRGILRAIGKSEIETAQGGVLRLRLAVDYSARHAITVAARSVPREGTVSYERFSRLLNGAIHSAPETPPVDLLIRTSGEYRLSDFLLWESAYAELAFVDTLWPEFSGAELKRLIEAFHRRERRFGGIRASRVG